MCSSSATTSPWTCPTMVRIYPIKSTQVISHIISCSLYPITIIIIQMATATRYEGHPPWGVWWAQLRLAPERQPQPLDQHVPGDPSIKFKKSWSTTSLSQIPMKNQKGIKFLDASFNELLEIPRNTFPKLYELETINFSHNNLTQVVHDGGDYVDGVDGYGDGDIEKGNKIWNKKWWWWWWSWDNQLQPQSDLQISLHASLQHQVHFEPIF